MKTKIIKLEQFNTNAMKVFIIDCIRTFSLPTFTEIYHNKDWSGGYQILSILCYVNPLVVKMYNERYYRVLTREN